MHILKLLFITILLGTISMANHLANSTSPYLLQHKDNPVEWYPYFQEAFDKAKKENKLIFLSIGYSTCHWCHEMARESFSDKEVADILNRYYISIKVDKEQLPHIDRYYQLGYRIVHHKAGGWPLTVILTPDQKPIFFATYIPKKEGYGSRGLIEILDTIAHYKRDKLQAIASKIQKSIQAYQQHKEPTQKLSASLESKASQEFKSRFDFEYFGFSKEPKFPQPYTLNTLIDIYQLTKDKTLHDMYSGMLQAMAKGGIYDQIDGAFYRYSVDRKWLMPHFEKMLYTNAKLLSVYARAYKLDKNPLYKQIITDSIALLDKKFKKNSLYYSASNADSPNAKGVEEEGYYYLFEYKNALSYLISKGFDRQNAKDVLAYLGIEEDGNFDGELSNPNIQGSNPPTNLTKAKKLLSKLREARVYPFIDQKINTAWNAMMIKALFDCGYVDEAKESLDALLNLMYSDGILYHQTLLPHKPSQKALLEDYAFLADALWGAYEATLEKNYLKLFEKFVMQSLDFYIDGMWLESSDGFKSYASIEDSTYQSALSLNLENILKLSAINSDYKLKNIVQKTIDNYSKELNTHPSYYPSALRVSLMLKDDIFLLKSQAKNLSDIDTKNYFEYPYIYKYAEDLNYFMLCGSSSCYGSSKLLDEIKEMFSNLKHQKSLSLKNFGENL